MPANSYAWGWALLVLLLGTPARAQPVGPAAATTAALGDESPEIESATSALVLERESLTALEGKPIRALSVETAGRRWRSKESITSVPVGEPLSEAVARRALRELLATGRFAQARADARAFEGGVILRLLALPRRIIAGVQWSGAELDPGPTLQAAGLAEGGELTEPMLARAAERIREYYGQHGYAAARVRLETRDTDDPMRVVLLVAIAAGQPRTVARRIFVIEPTLRPLVAPLAAAYAVEAGDVLDETALAAADAEMTEALQRHGFLRAQVGHATRERGSYSFLYVYLQTGPRYEFELEGVRHFEQSELLSALQLESGGTDVSVLAERLRGFYTARGFLDVVVLVSEPDATAGPQRRVRFSIREGERVDVESRIFPCLPPEAAEQGLAPAELDAEIDRFLEQALPSPSFFSAPDPAVIDAQLGPTAAGRRARPLRFEAARTLSQAGYDRAIEHLRDLVRSKGYRNALVGPVFAWRARCDPKARGERCVPLPLRALPRAACRRDALELPVPEPPLGDAYGCRPDPKRAVRCAPSLKLYIPIQLGPRTILYDVVFEGNEALPSRQLLDVAAYSLGSPLSDLELDAARRRVLDAYRDEGYAYAAVRTAVELSPDQTRARARFLVSEHQPVVITGYEVRGAIRTSPELILGRLALCQDLDRCSDEQKRFRRELARKSEERIATLGTFTSVSIGLEDPDIPESHKRVIIAVVERGPQYVETRVGFSTGEGFRVGFEYGHRNVAGQAISLTVRLELGLLPDLLIFDPDVRESYGELTLGQRLERRNSGSLRFPEIGLGPLVSLTVDGVDLRDNHRDFGQTKEALLPTLGYRPLRDLSAQLGASVELNDVQLFAAKDVKDAISQNPALASLLRVPKGRTVALGQRLGATWDRRDNAFAATSGTLVTGGIEHVSAFPSDESASIESEFLRLTAKASGYLRLSSSGAALALSVSAGYNQQLTSTSQTYPDRLFYLGGVDTLRGFLLDSVVPEDFAQKILGGETVRTRDGQERPLDASDVPVRGGNLFVCPRIELRTPLTDTFGLGLFLDSGNVWSSESSIESPMDLLRLRYAAGAGLRLATPIGPLAFDYGFNLVRRPWEDLGALHFSVGVF